MRNIQVILIALAFLLSAAAFALRISGVDDSSVLMTALPGIAALAFGVMLWTQWKARRG